MPPIDVLLLWKKMPATLSTSLRIMRAPTWFRSVPLPFVLAVPELTKRAMDPGVHACAATFPLELVDQLMLLAFHTPQLVNEPLAGLPKFAVLPLVSKKNVA